MLRNGLARLCRQAERSSQGLWAAQRTGMATNSHDVFNIHQHTSENNWDTPFDFSPENYKIAKMLMSRYPSNYKQSAVIPLLDLAQKQNEGWLSLNAMNKVAEVLGMAPIRVYEVATFYTMFNRSRIGKYHVMVCETTPCMLCGSREVAAAIKKHLGIGYGQTTKDGMITLGEMECMGACANAPMITVADYSNGVEGFSYKYFEDLAPQDAVKIVTAYQKGEKPQMGSLYRSKAEPRGTSSTGEWVPGPSVEQTLTFASSGGKPPGPFCRDLDPPAPDAPSPPNAKQ